VAPSSPDDPSSIRDENPQQGETSPKQDDEQSDDKILERARKFFQVSGEAWHQIRLDALADIKFSAGDQWDKGIRGQREVEGRPCLTINRIPQFIQQVTNDQRQNRPAIKIHPVDDKADVETAKVRSGIVRHIEYNSNAEAAYDTGFEGAARGGFGFWRIVTEYCDPTSFDQEIVIKRIPNQFSVFFDPHSVEPDGSDANEGGISEDLSKEQYARVYPNSKLAQMGEWDIVGNNYPDWMPGGCARIAEYFYKEYQDENIYQLVTGEIVLGSELPEGTPQEAIKSSRKTQIPKICWIKMNAVEILDRTVIPGSGQWIPIIPVFGNDLIVDGKRVLESLTRHAKDPQRMLNYWKSAETEAIALAPKAPYIIAEGQLEGYEEIWKSANRSNHAYLPYKPVALNGAPVPPPQRQAFEPAVQAITQAAMLAADDLKAVTGIYDAALGARSNENSGIAIQRRNIQSQTSNFHFIDNLSRSIKHTGRIINDWLPDVYDSARTARIIGEDGSQEIIQLNTEPAPGSKQDRTYDLSVGRYDVTVDVGPSFASKRQEAVASILDLSKAMPQLPGVAGDLIIKNMDWPGAQDIADRVRKTLPPGLADEGKGKQPIPPELQARMQQMNQMIQHLTGELQHASDPMVLERMRLESRERIELAKLKTDAEIEMAKMGSKEAIALLGHQIAEIESRLNLVGISQPIGAESPESIPSPEPAEMPPGAGDPQAQNPTGGESPGPSVEGQPNP
jgi:hypothetical protein